MRTLLWCLAGIGAGILIGSRRCPKCGCARTMPGPEQMILPTPWIQFQTDAARELEEAAA